jgi:hypothetical protein
MSKIDIVYRRSMRLILFPLAALVLIGVMWMAGRLVTGEPTLDTEMPPAAERVEPVTPDDQPELRFEQLPQPETEPVWQPAPGMEAEQPATAGEAPQAEPASPEEL